MNALGAILSILAAVVTALLYHYRQQSKQDTPEAKEKKDVAKFDSAMATGDTNTMSTMFNELSIPENPDSCNNTSRQGN